LFEEKWVDKYLKKPEAPALLERSEKKFSENSLDSYDEIKSVFDRLIEESGLSTNQIYQTLRGALTGSLVSLGLIETVDFLGREEVVRRIRNALGRLRA
jgi:glutamyl-tRNA synthetase